MFRRRRQEPEFALQEKDALERATATLISAAVERCVHGVERVRFKPSTGTPFYDLEYSDTILIRLLERADPSFRTKQTIDMQHSGETPVHITRAERLKALQAARKEMAEAKARANGQYSVT